MGMNELGSSVTEAELVTPSYTAISGGRTNPYAEQLFVYHEAATSMSRIEVED